MGFFKGLKNKFETAVVNESSVYKPLYISQYLEFLQYIRVTLDDTYWSRLGPWCQSNLLFCSDLH